jgi:hypothetical protein
VKVDEQRVLFVVRPATGSTPAASRRHFLIANLELKFNVSYIRINDLKFSNKIIYLTQKRHLAILFSCFSTHAEQPA